MDSKVTYIGHSGFSVETDGIYMLFDYFKGEVKCPTEAEEIYIFSSHFHKDHFNPAIFDIFKAYGNVTYILSEDIRSRVGSAYGDRNIIYVKPRCEYKLGSLTVRTLKSTDEGVAFVVYAGDRVIYHAGDLNDWYWSGEPVSVNNDMTARYRRELDSIKSVKLDLAFVPLDPRQEEAYHRGMRYFADNIKAERIFPMHCWGKYEIIDRYISEYGGDDRIMRINKERQEFII
jgi:L-ascorbate metabolism protein UlaG (beta-lactamase superfamily)